MSDDSRGSIESIKKLRGSNIVNVRVPLALISNIDDWVESHEFKSRSEFIVASIRHYLDYLAFRDDYAHANPRGRMMGDIKQSIPDKREPEKK